MLIPFIILEKKNTKNFHSEVVAGRRIHDDDEEEFKFDTKS
jgi:2-oxo-4-hydroxy-4-carboxy--5-ureidoimidazoline (OHCU) decarboxylase